MDYYQISKETVKYLYDCHKSLKKSPLDQTLRTLIELFVSQINGCKFCIQTHTNEAINLGVSKEKLEELSSWNSSNLYSNKEKIALEWCELVTQTEQNTDVSFLESVFSEREIVDLTVTISLMNALNRIAIYLK